MNYVTHTVYVANGADSSLSVIDGPTGTVLGHGRHRRGPGRGGPPPGGGQVLVTGTLPAGASGSGTTPPGAVVEVIAAATDAVTTSFATDSGPHPVAVDPSTGYVFTADSTAGRRGAGDVAIIPLFLGVDDPGSQPDVTDVGGTDLTQWATGPVSRPGTIHRRQSRHTRRGRWAGISSVFALPSYQSGIVGAQSSPTPCGAATGYCREVPDVSASADPNNGYVISYKGAWTAFGGTKRCGTPLGCAGGTVGVAERHPPATREHQPGPLPVRGRRASRLQRRHHRQQRLLHDPRRDLRGRARL